VSPRGRTATISTAASSPRSPVSATTRSPPRRRGFPIACRTARDATRDRVLRHVLEALDDDASESLAPGKRWIDVEPRWLELCTAALAQIAREEPFLAYDALGVFAKAKPTPTLVTKVEALLADPRWEPLEVVKALVELKSKTWRQTLEQQMKVAKNEQRRADLEYCLECFAGDASLAVESW
jgi:hypothetical protein